MNKLVIENAGVVPAMEARIEELRDDIERHIGMQEYFRVDRDRLATAIDATLEALYDQSVTICPRVARAREILEATKK